jgi:hypothetical protein
VVGVVATQAEVVLVESTLALDGQTLALQQLQQWQLGLGHMSRLPLSLGRCTRQQAVWLQH